MQVFMVETGGWGGIGQSAHCLSNALAGEGCAVRLITHAKHYDLDAFPKAYPVEKVFEGDGLIADWRRLFALCRKYKPDVVHFQSLISTRRDCLMFWWMKRLFPHIRLIITVHNVLPHEVARGERWSYSMLYRLVDGLILHCQASLHRLNDLIGVGYKHPAVVIPLGHFGEFSEGSNDRKQALASLKLKDFRYLTCFGAIRPYKGVDWLLHAVAGIENWPEDIKVLVIGKLFVGVTEEELLDLRAALGLEKRVVFRFGYLPDNQIPDVFAVSDVILLPYRDIDQSAVLMAALAASKPVVCTPVGAFPEVVNTEVGFLASMVSKEAFGQALGQAIEKRELWPAMGEKSQNLSERVFCWTGIAQRTIDFYKQVIEHK